MSQRNTIWLWSRLRGASCIKTLVCLTGLTGYCKSGWFDLRVVLGDGDAVDGVGWLGLTEVADAVSD